MDMMSEVTGNKPYHSSRESTNSFYTSGYSVHLTVSAGGDGSSDVSLKTFLDDLENYLDAYTDNVDKSAYKRSVVFNSKSGTTNRSTVTIRVQGA
jgi:hypothetical protein